MARITYLTPFSMRDDRDFVSSNFADIGAGGTGTFSNVEIVNAGAQTIVSISGDFIFNLVGVRTGPIGSVRGGQIVDEQNNLFQLEYTVTNTDAKLEDLDDAILAGEPAGVWRGVHRRRRHHPRLLRRRCAVRLYRE